jgi:hypothetical protein
MLERLVSDKHSRLLMKICKLRTKKFYNIGPWSAKMNVPQWRHSNWNNQRTAPIKLFTVVTEQHFFAFSLNVQGTTEKVLQYILPLMSVYNKHLDSVEREMYFWTQRRGSINKKSNNWHYFLSWKIFMMTFSELPPIGLC